MTAEVERSGGEPPEPTRLSDRKRRKAEPAPRAEREGFTIITGLSGAGRSEAARCLEDLGYFVVDNLPPALLPKMAELGSRPGGPGRVAIVLGAWCVAALVLCLVSFRWTSKRDG